MKFYSPNFLNSSPIPALYTADGDNICPDFYISDVPENTKTLAILCHDPDATAGIPWVHWLVWNLPASTINIVKGHLPTGSIEGTTSFGTKGYGGPFPSPGSGPHRYVFTLFALDKKANLKDDIPYSYEDILSTLSPLSVSAVDWTGIYQRV